MGEVRRHVPASRCTCRRPRTSIRDRPAETARLRCGRRTATRSDAGTADPLILGTRRCCENQTSSRPAASPAAGGASGNELGTHRSRNPVFAHHRSDGRAGPTRVRISRSSTLGMVGIFAGTPGISRYGPRDPRRRRPGARINGVIASATIEAINTALRVIGSTTATGTSACKRHLPKCASGGWPTYRASIHRRLDPCGRRATNPRQRSSPPRPLPAFAAGQLGVRYLCASRRRHHLRRDAHRRTRARRHRRRDGTETIDNDLPLPDNAPTSASRPARRAVGTNIVESLNGRRAHDRALVLVREHGPQVGLRSPSVCARPPVQRWP